MTTTASARVPLRTLFQGHAYTLPFDAPGPGLFIIRDQAGWASLWARLTSGEQPARDAPEVGWGSELVVVLILGWRPTAGFHVEIEQVMVVDGVLQVRAWEDRPGGMTAEMITFPVHAVAVPAIDVGDELLLIQRITAAGKY